ncbi:MAG: hypothetical protein ACTSYI_01465 [Promethearchaeota archaeon]
MNSSNSNNNPNTKSDPISKSDGIYNIMIVGVGGLGVITLGKFFQEYALYDSNIQNMVAMESRGVSQREGSVYAIVRYLYESKSKSISSVFAAIPPLGQVHLMIALEPLEFIRNIKYCHSRCQVILNDNLLIPKSAIKSNQNFHNILEEKLALVEQIYPEMKIIRKNFSQIAITGQTKSIRPNQLMVKELFNIPNQNNMFTEEHLQSAYADFFSRK